MDGDTTTMTADEPTLTEKTMPNDELPKLLEALPEQVQAFIMSKQPRLKDQPANPEDFYGRDGEIAMLVDAVKTVTTGQTETSAITAEIMAAAPGAGKTSLLDAFERRLAKDGIGHIRLEPKDLLSPEAFSEAVIRHPPYCYFANAKAALTKTTDTIGVVVDSVFYIGTHAAAKLFTAGQADVPNTNVTEKVIQTWRQGKAPQPRDVVKAIDTMWRAGTVITVDEAQDLADLAEKGNPKKCATEIISTLTSPDPRGRAGIKRATICFFGLADTYQAVNELGSPTVNTHILSPLHADYVEMMINGAIDKATKRDEELNRWAKKKWTKILVKEFGDWTRHGQAATEATYDMLKKFGKQLMHEKWSTRAVRALANEYKESTYRHIRKRAATKGVKTWMRDIAVQALWCNGNKVNQGTMRDMLEQYIERKTPSLNEKEVEKRVERTTRRLLRSGIMDSTDDLRGHENLAAFYSPIPSLLQHLSGDEMAEQKAIRNLLKANGLNSNPNRRTKKLFRPKWFFWTKERSTALNKPAQDGTD